MDKTLANIFGSEGLPEELQTVIQEAFDAKVTEAQERIREEAEMTIRAEFAARFNHDKANLVEAIHRMLTDVVTVTENKKATEIAKLKEARKRLEKTIKESKKTFASKLTEHVSVADRFVVKQLAKTVKSLTEEKKALLAKKVQLETAFTKVKKTMAEQQQVRFNKIDKFVMRQVSKELNEFQQDHKALIETRVKLVKESKSKLMNTQKRFVSEAAKKVEVAINTHLKNEMKQLHEDIERNRQNTFGRRIFEAIAAEYMTSYLSEGSEIRKLQSVLESKNKELRDATTKLNETKKAVEAAGRKEKLAEDRATRTKVLSELLGSLKGGKRAVMSSMLETVRTEHLRSSFEQYLPVVLSENSKTVLKTNDRPAPRRIVEVNGDQPSRLTESAFNELDTEIEAEMATIVRLAGIHK